MKPFNDHTRSIPPELVRDASPLLRRLWGALHQLRLAVSNVVFVSRLPAYLGGSNLDATLYNLYCYTQDLSHS